MTEFSIVAIVLALMIMGFVFKNGILFLASSLGWILFAFMMYGQEYTNPALNIGLLMFGGAMFFITAFLALGQMMSGRQPKNMMDEQEAYKRKVLKVTKRR